MNKAISTKSAKQMRHIEANLLLNETRGMHPGNWKKLGEQKLHSISQGQHPKVLAIGPRVIGSLTRLYRNKQGHLGKPGDVFEVTTKSNGELDNIGAGSVFYAIKHLGVHVVDIWGNGGRTHGSTRNSLEKIAGSSLLEIRELKVSGSEITDVADADAVVVACSDSRVQVHHIFENAVVVSNAGNILSPTAIEVIGDLVLQGVPIVTILGHTKCGAVGAAVGGATEKELSGIMSVINENTNAKEIADAEVQNAVASANLLKGNSLANYFGESLQNLQHKIKKAGTTVLAQFLDLATGEVRNI